MGISTLSRTEHSTAQTRETECCKVVLPQVQKRGQNSILELYLVLIYPTYLCALGLHITEVAHDIQGQVSKYVTKDLGLVNSYDTWHGMFRITIVSVLTLLCKALDTHSCHFIGTKNVAKELRKITEGRVRDRDVSWFPELYYKSKMLYTALCTSDIIHICVHLGVLYLGQSIKTHLYWSMKNCGNSPDTLQQLIQTICNHYMVL